MAVQAQLHAENMGLASSMSGLQDWMTLPAPILPSFDTDYCFTPQQILPFHLQQNAQSFVSASSPSSSTCNNFLPVAFSQSLDAQLEVQRQELNCILHLQNERLKTVLREQRKRELGTVLKCMESKALYLMKQKEDDLARATNKTMELEACLRKAEKESSSWERLAKANEAMVMNLSNTLEHAKESLIRASNTAEDAESLCCDDDDHQQQQEEDKNSKNIACKHCNSRSSCVLFLPCRHLCSCISCEAFLDSCPVCKSVKEASLKVFLV